MHYSCQRIKYLHIYSDEYKNIFQDTMATGFHEKPPVLFEIHVQAMQKDKHSPKKKSIRNLGMLIQIFFRL